MTSASQLPAERKKDLEKTVKDFYAVEDLDAELLEDAAEMGTK